MNPELQKKADKAKALQTSVNTLATAEKQGLNVTKRTTVEQARKFSANKPPIVPPTDANGGLDASSMKNGGAVTTPAPTAPTVQESYQTGILESATKARTDLETKLTAERDAALKRQEALNKKLESIQRESDPTKRATYEQEQRIVRNQLDASEKASQNLEKDMERRRAIADELIRTSSAVNTQIDIMRSAPVALKIQNGNLTQTIQNGQARIGILQASVSALDGNISQAHTMIDNASNAVAALWQDEVAYNNAYLKLVESGQLATNKIHDDYASSQIALAENKLTQLEETKKYITNMMIDPKTAQFMAEAGVTLNDSIDEINTKMKTRANYEEREDTINELTLEGYKYVPFAEGRTDVVKLNIGGQELAFVPPVDEMKELQLEQMRANIQSTRALANQRSGSVSGTGTTINASTDLGLAGTIEDPMLDIMTGSKGGRVLTQSEAEPLTNAKRVADGLDDIQAVISNSNTDPILGLFQKVNPYNLNARAIDVAINTLVPQLARGTYGEVGVLTDSDMARYANTLPNLTSTTDQNKAVMALTLRKVRSGFAAQIESMAAAGRDVSGYTQIYMKFNDQINRLESEIGIGQANDVDIDNEYNQLFRNNSTTTSTAPVSNQKESGGFWKNVGKFFFGE